MITSFQKNIPLKVKVLNYIKSQILGTAYCSDVHFDKLSNNVCYSQSYLSHHYETNLPTRTPLAVMCQKKEWMIEQILDSKTYTFPKILLILNPFYLAPLSAMLIFNTKSPCKVQYTIKGRNGSPDFTNVDENFSTRHRTAVVGLFENCYNPVTITLLDQANKPISTKKIRIKTREIQNHHIHGCVEVTNSSQSMLGEFKLVSGGQRGGVYAFDTNGNIRFALTKRPQSYGVYLLNSGKFLFPEPDMRMPAFGNAHTVITHEMDFLGRVSHTYYDERGYHHWAIEKENDGNILSLSSSVSDTYMENTVVEINRFTGERVWEINVNDLFDNTYKTRNDWAHINAVDYISSENAVLISMRNIHTIAKIKIDTKEIVWILSNPDFYSKTTMKDKVLTPVGDIDWFFQQHAVKIVTENHHHQDSKLQIMLFDNHTANRRPVPWFDGKQESNVLFYTIDEKKKTVSMDNRFPVPLSITRSNIEYIPEKNVVTAMCGNLKPHINDFSGKIIEFDYTTKECLNEFSFHTDFFSAHTITFPITALSTPLSDKHSIFRGQLKSPEKISILPEDVKHAETMPENVSQNLIFLLCGDLLQIKAVDHNLEKIYVYNEKERFLMDFTDTTQPLKVFKKQKYYVSLPLHDLPNGNYQIAVQYLSKTYDTSYHVTLRSKKTKENILLSKDNITYQASPFFM